MQVNTKPSVHSEQIGMLGKVMFVSEVAAVGAFKQADNMGWIYYKFSL